MALQRVSCPSCRSVFEMDERGLGKEVPCPTCDARVVATVVGEARFQARPIAPPAAAPALKRPVPQAAAPQRTRVPVLLLVLALLLMGGLAVGAGGIAWFFVLRPRYASTSPAQAAASAPQPEQTALTAPEPPPKKPFDVALIPDSFNGAIIMHPQRLLRSPTLEPLPRDRFLEPVRQLGIDPDTVEQLVCYIDPFPGGNVAFMPAVVGRFREPVDVLGLLKKHFPTVGKRDIGGKTVHVLPTKVAQTSVCVYAPDPRSVVVAAEPTLRKMLSAAPRGPLVERLRKADLDHDLVGIFTVEPVRILARQGLKDVEKKLPADYAAVPTLPDLLEAVTLSLDLGGPTLLQLDFEARDAEAARVIGDMLKSGHDTLTKQYPSLRQALAKDAPPDIGPAVLGVLDDLVAGISVRQEGTSVRGSLAFPRGLPGLVKQLAPMAQQLVPAKPNAPAPVTPTKD